MAVKHYMETDNVSDFLKIYRDHPDAHAEIDEYNGDVRIKEIHVDPNHSSIYDANCDVVYENGRTECMPLHRISLYRYDFKEGDYAVNSKGTICIIGKIEESNVYLHALLEDILVEFNNGRNEQPFGLWLLSTLQPCKEWQIRAMDAELLRIGKRFNKYTKQIENVETQSC